MWLLYFVRSSSRRTQTPSWEAALGAPDQQAVRVRSSREERLLPGRDATYPRPSVHTEQTKAESEECSSQKSVGVGTWSWLCVCSGCLVDDTRKETPRCTDHSRAPTTRRMGQTQVSAVINRCTLLPRPNRRQPSFSTPLHQ